MGKGGGRGYGGQLRLFKNFIVFFVNFGWFWHIDEHRFDFLSLIKCILLI